MQNPMWHANCGKACMEGRPGTSNSSYGELERCLRLMRERRRHLYWHVAERFIRCRYRLTQGCSECRPPQATPYGVFHNHKVSGKLRKIPRTDIIEESWNPRVIVEMVDRGVAWLSADFRGTPFLPTDVFKQATGQVAA